MSSQSSTQRRRGIRASRLKLTRALEAQGLTTQAALAERIADLETLESAPKDMVNRAFRERPVELRSLDRIARALDVEPHSLYKTADEPEAAPAGTAHNGGGPPPLPPQPWPSRWPMLITGSLAAALVSLVVTVLLTGQPRLLDEGQPASPPPLNLGDGALMVLPVESPHGAELTAALRAALGGDFQVATATAGAAVETADVAGLARRLRLNVIVESEVVTLGRLAGIRAFAFAGGVRRQVWAESLPVQALGGEIQAVAARVAAAVRHATGLGGDTLPHYPLAPVQDDYLHGQHYLDEPASELNLKRAQTRFASALRQDSNYARAHAGLCHALLASYWMQEEHRVLQDAARACSQAVLLAPRDPVVITAQAHFLHRTGRLDEAIARYDDVLRTAPQHTPALEGLSDAYLDRYRRDGDRQFLEQAMAAVRQAADAEPMIWKPLFTLGTLRWFDGDLTGAIAATEQALARHENEYVLANLGTFYVCAGEFEKARDSYLRARDLAPASYVGDEFLGMAYYFLGDYDQAVRLQERAIESIADGQPEMHEMWGHLGDAYRRQGNHAGAISAYRRAATIAERDYLRGAMPAADQAARAYYYTMLKQMELTAVPDRIDARIAAQLDEIGRVQVESAAHRRMAQIWWARGEPAKALTALERATASCPGYAQLPDLADLVAQNRAE